MMNQELIYKLYNDFPNLFPKDFNNFWITYDGWFDLIYDLSKEINSIIESMKPFEDLNNLPNYQVVQCKEKFGSLRYYMSESTKEMDDIIAIFENKSYDICALCGKDKGPRSSKESAWGLNFCETCSIIKNIIE